MSRSMTKTARFLERAIDACGKSQIDIAYEAGFENPNILSMMKRGISKVPLERILDLANACGVDAAEFLTIAMQEYQPKLWTILNENFGDRLNHEEVELVLAHRSAASERKSAEKKVFENAMAALDNAIDGLKAKKRMGRLG